MLADYKKEVADRKKKRRNSKKAKKGGAIQLDNLPHDLPSLMQLGLSGTKLAQIDFNNLTNEDAYQLLMLGQMSQHDIQGMTLDDLEM